MDLLSHSSVDQKSRQILLDLCVGFHNTEVKASARLISGVSEKEPASRLIQIVCRVHFLQTGELRVLFLLLAISWKQS